ncbi:MAG: hypothetical protein QM786_15915 [Breznakibacter sp.]
MDSPHNAFWAVLFAGIAIVTSCTQKSDESNGKRSNSGNEYLVADTIFYPVRIKNINPDDEWADIRLKKLDRKKLVDQLFESVYSGQAIAYNYLTDSPIPIDEIKEMEQTENYSRDNVVELEFREKWWFAPNEPSFRKEVLSILVAYAAFEDDGSLRGLKAAFYIKSKN